MFTKSTITAFVVCFAFLIAGCGGSSTHLARPSKLDGTWKSSDPAMTATISHNTIEIDMDLDSASGLYWKGTLPSTTTEGSELVSEGDTSAMDHSMLGSQNARKSFVYKDGKLTFPFSILGITRTVELER